MASSDGSLPQVYSTVLKGVGPLKGAEVAARRAKAGGRSERQAVMALVRSHVAMAGAQGFAAGLGGWVTQLVAMPASAGAVAFLQVRLAASIAHVYGHDLDDAEVRRQILSCVSGAQRVGGAARVGAQSKAARKAAVTVVGKVAARGGRLLGKTAAGPVAKAAGKGLPYVGGVIGGGIDAVATGVVGEMARRTFAPEVVDAPPDAAAPTDPDAPADAGTSRSGRGRALVAGAGRAAARRGLAPFRKLTSRRARVTREDAGVTVLGDVVPDLSVATVEIGWTSLALDPPGADVDVSAFLCRRTGKVPSDDHFVFYNNPGSPDGAVTLDPGALTDADEHAKAAFTIDTAAIPASIQKIVFAVSAYGSGATFGAMDGGFLSVVDQTQDLEIIRYDQPDRHAGTAAVVIGELKRGRGGWVFHPVDVGYPDGLAAVADRYGVEVDQASA